MARLLLVSALLTAPLVAACAGLLGVTPLTSSEDDAGSVGDGGATSRDGGPDAANGADGTGADAAEAADAMVAVDAASECSAAWIGGAAGSVPTGAIPSEPPGEAGIAIYVCRTPHAGSGSDTVPGKLLPGWGCYYGDGSAEVLTTAGYEVLVATGCAIAWQAAPSGVVPANAFPCGQDSQGVLYSCRVEQPDGDVGEGELGHMGWGTSHQCVYDYSGQSLSAVVFDVLTLR
jgi:hypothetical protein